MRIQGTLYYTLTGLVLTTINSSTISFQQHGTQIPTPERQWDHIFVSYVTVRFEYHTTQNSWPLARNVNNNLAKHHANPPAAMWGSSQSFGSQRVRPSIDIPELQNSFAELYSFFQSIQLGSSSLLRLVAPGSSARHPAGG